MRRCPNGFRKNSKGQCKKKTTKSSKKSTKSSKKTFLFNPKNPKKSFDVYIDKNPKDTISIKYTTIDDVTNTIKKLEKLYKNKSYSHKRIFQVAMILKVRLRVLKDKKKTHYKLAERYYNFIKSRTPLKTFSERKNFVFKF